MINRFEGLNVNSWNNFLSLCEDFEVDMNRGFIEIGFNGEDCDEFFTVEKLLYLINSVTYWKIETNDYDEYEIWINDLEITFINISLVEALFMAFQELFVRGYYN